MKPVIPPPVILIFFVGIALGIDVFSPFDLLLGQSRLPLALVFGGVGVLIAVLGVLQFQKHKTTINPHKIDKAKALVTGGVYRFTRNPMYLGMLLVLIGVVFYSRDVLALVTLPGFVVTLNRLQIQLEERALRAMFGDAFEAYCARTRRWI
jgi:protein-S-isoprenylcysteine O-methyltransferase Ste14